MPEGSGLVTDLQSREALERALRAARLEVARVETRRDAARTQLATMTWQVHRLASIWHSPVSTLMWQVVVVLRAIRRRVTPYPPLPMVGPWERVVSLPPFGPTRSGRTPDPPIDPQGQGDAIRWVGPVSVPNTRRALFAHADSRIVYRLPALPPSGRSSWMAWYTRPPGDIDRSATHVHRNCQLPDRRLD